jgi:flagellar basal-body rod modification protein FlgD
MSSPVGGVTAPDYSKASSTVERGDQMGKEVFMQLLVAQMRYQDPSSPMDSSQMMAQTATFTQVGKLEELAKQNAAMLVLQEASTAGSMVGRTATYTDSNGADVTGKITAVRLAQGNQEAVAIIGGKDVPVGRITAFAQ